MSCPNINSREWKDLVAVGGEEFAYRVGAHRHFRQMKQTGTATNNNQCPPVGRT